LLRRLERERGSDICVCEWVIAVWYTDLLKRLHDRSPASNCIVVGILFDNGKQVAEPEIIPNPLHTPMYQRRVMSDQTRKIDRISPRLQFKT
jgi:hypothetical protein